MDIEEAIASTAEGSTEGLKVIYEQYRTSVFSIALAILKNKAEAEDVLQETFVRLYDKASSYKPGSNPKAWITTIARNISYDLLRQKKVKPTDNLNDAI